MAKSSARIRALQHAPNPLDVQRMRRAGVIIPVRAVMAAKEAGLPLSIAASILIQESGGGRNAWGHDRTIFVGGYDALHHHDYGPLVTEESYHAYLKQRGLVGRGGMQGVGPCQLTWYALQDDADELGGCWRPLPNMRIGFGKLAAAIRRSGLRLGVQSYNGTGPAAVRYADAVLARAERFRKDYGL